MKVIRNYILNNLYLNDKLSTLHCSPPRSRQKFPDSKNSKIWQIWPRYFRFDDSVLIVIKVIRNDILINLHISMMNFLLCTVLFPGASKVYLTHKFDNFLNLIQLFPMTLYSVLVEMNDVNNVIYHNFEYHDQLLKMHRFITRNL